MADCETSADEEVRSYRCFGCGALLVVVVRPTDRPLSGNKFLPGNWWSIRSTGELSVKLGQSQLNLPPARQ